MTAHEELQGARAIVNRFSQTGWSRALLHDLRSFLGHLQAVADGSPSDATAETVAEVRREADRMIECLEQRLASGHDRATVQREMAAAVYEIRVRVEQVEVWYRHYSRV